MKGGPKKFIATTTRARTIHEPKTIQNSWPIHKSTSLTFNHKPAKKEIVTQIKSHHSISKTLYNNTNQRHYDCHDSNKPNLASITRSRYTQAVRIKATYRKRAWTHHLLYTFTANLVYFTLTPPRIQARQASVV